MVSDTFLLDLHSLLVQGKCTNFNSTFIIMDYIYSLFRTLWLTIVAFAITGFGTASLITPTVKAVLQHSK